MKERTTKAKASPADCGKTDHEQSVDAEVLAFRSQFEARSPLDELIRAGAQRMLQAAIDADVEGFLAQHAKRSDAQGRRLVVHTGHLLSRER